MTLNRPRWPWEAIAFAVGYGTVRLYWAAGGRWGYTACDRSHETADMSSGCAARQLSTLPLQGWGAVALCCALIAVATLATRSHSRAAAVGTWVPCAALVVVSFPMHLLFQIPAALAGYPTAWRDLVNRLLLPLMLIPVRCRSSHPRRTAW